MWLDRLFKGFCIVLMCAALVVVGWESFSFIQYHAQKNNLQYAETLVKIAASEFGPSAARLHHHSKRTDLECDVLRQVSTGPVRALIAQLQYFIEHARLMSGLEKLKGQLTKAQDLAKRAAEVELQVHEYEKLVRTHELRIAGKCERGTLAEASSRMPLLFLYRKSEEQSSFLAFDQSSHYAARRKDFFGYIVMSRRGDQKRATHVMATPNVMSMRAP